MIDDILLVGGGCPLLSEVHDVGAADTSVEGLFFHQLTLELQFAVPPNEHILVQRALNLSKLSAATTGPLMVHGGMIVFAGSAVATTGVEIELGRVTDESLQGSR